MYYQNIANDETVRPWHPGIQENPGMIRYCRPTDSDNDNHSLFLELYHYGYDQQLNSLTRKTTLDLALQEIGNPEARGEVSARALYELMPSLHYPERYRHLRQNPGMYMHAINQVRKRLHFHDAFSANYFA